MSELKSVAPPGSPKPPPASLVTIPIKSRSDNSRIKSRSGGPKKSGDLTQQPPARAAEGAVPAPEPAPVALAEAVPDASDTPSRVLPRKARQPDTIETEAHASEKGERAMLEREPPPEDRQAPDESVYSAAGEPMPAEPVLEIPDRKSWDRESSMPEAPIVETSVADVPAWETLTDRMPSMEAASIELGPVEAAPTEAAPADMAPLDMLAGHAPELEHLETPSSLAPIPHVVTLTAPTTALPTLGLPVLEMPMRQDAAEGAAEAEAPTLDEAGRGIPNEEFALGEAAEPELEQPAVPPSTDFWPEIPAIDASASDLPPIVYASDEAPRAERSQVEAPPLDLTEPTEPTFDSPLPPPEVALSSLPPEPVSNAENIAAPVVQVTSDPPPLRHAPPTKFSPPPAAITESILDYWRHQRGARHFPATGDLDRGLIARRWPDTWLLDFTGTAGDSRREPNLTRVMRLGAPGVASEAELQYSGYVTEWIIELGRAAVTSGAAVEEIERLSTQSGAQAYRVRALPLGPANGVPDHVLCELARAETSPRFGRRRNWLSN